MIKSFAAIVGTLLCLVSSISWGTECAGDMAITAVVNHQLKRYEQALNASDVDGVMKLYAADAVVMAQNNMPAVGRDAVRQTYLHVFSSIKLKIRFDIDEIHPLTQDWAFARTRSNGQVKVLASHTSAKPEANQELFLFHRDADGEWRIARYIFSTTNVPQL